MGKRRVSSPKAQLQHASKSWSWRRKEVGLEATGATRGGEKRSVGRLNQILCKLMCKSKKIK